MKKKLSVLFGSVFALTPVMVLAQGATCTQVGIIKMLCEVAKILGAIVPVLVTLGVVFFVYGVITYVIADDEEAKSKGRDRIIFGLIGLAVIVAMWGLVGILTDTFDVDNEGAIPGGLPGTFTP